MVAVPRDGKGASYAPNGIGVPEGQTDSSLAFTAWESVPKDPVSAAADLKEVLAARAVSGVDSTAANSETLEKILSRLAPFFAFGGVSPQPIDHSVIHFDRVRSGGNGRDTGANICSSPSRNEDTATETSSPPSKI